MCDKPFMNVNQVFTGMLHQLCLSGLDITKHKAAIGAGDMLKMYTSGVLGTHSPEALQIKCSFS